MILDLKGETHMDHLVGMLYSAVNENDSRLISIVSDMSQQEIDYKGPNQTYNSTAQLIRHLAYVDLNWIFRIKGEPIPKQLEEKYGPMLDQNNKIPFISGVSLKQISLIMKKYSACLSLFVIN